MLNRGTHSYYDDPRNQHILIFINGRLRSRENATISVFDSGFLLGDGVWEGIRLLNGKLVFLDEHLNRLYRGAKKLAIEVGQSKQELINLIWNTLGANKMTTDVHIRLIISRGIKKTPFQHPNVNIGKCSIVIIPEYKKPNEKVINKGLALATVNIRRGTKNCQDPQLNTLSKFNCIAACIEADNAGADEGIMLDINGNVATCNSTNFFIVRKNEVWTSTGRYCLPGITRKIVIDICKNNNIPILLKNFKIRDVHSADEAFVTGTFSGILPVIKIDENDMSGGIRGNITKQLQKLYFQKLNKMYPEEIQ